MSDDQTDAGFEVFMVGVEERIDNRPKPETPCRHGVPSDFICDICERNTPKAELVPFPVKLGLQGAEPQKGDDDGDLS